MSPLRTRWTLAALLGSAAFFSIVSVVAVRQRSGQELLAQLPPGQCYADKPPSCATSCLNGVEMDLGNACYCAGPCTDLSGNPGTCGAGTCAASCIAANGNCATTNLPCCTGLVCNTGAGANATCVSTSQCNNNGTCDSAAGERTSTCSDCRCGDGLCNPIDEDANNCSTDCGGGGSCGNGAVDPGEECDGGACCTYPECRRKPASTPCTPPDGRCNSNGECIMGCGNGICGSGESFASCPADCPVSACGNGVINAGEQCEKVNGVFPPCCGNDCKFAASTTVCRTSTATCDVAETCPGTSATCPADTFAPSSTVCRASVGSCDVEEKCTGNTVTCPADSKKSNGTACPDDGVVCTEDKCNGIDNDCKHQAGINCPVSSASSSASSFSSTSSVTPSSSPASSAASSVPSSAVSSVLSSSLPPPSSSASSVSSVVAWCCFPFTGCIDKWTGVCAKQYGTGQECQVKCKAGSSVSPASSSQSTSSLPLSSSVKSSSSIAVASSISSSASSAQSLRYLGTCKGWSPFTRDQLPGMDPVGPSTAISTEPPNLTMPPPSLHCAPGGAEWEWEGETGFCLRNGTCSETPEDANGCAGNEDNPLTVFGNFGDCKEIETNFGRL